MVKGPGSVIPQTWARIPVPPLSPVPPLPYLLSAGDEASLQGMILTSCMRETCPALAWLTLGARNLFLPPSPPTPISLGLRPVASLPRGFPPHQDLHRREGITLGQESRTLGPDSHFALLCCETSGKYLPLSGLARSSQRHSLIVGVQVVSSWGRWNFLCACLGQSRCSGNEHGHELSGSLAISGHQIVQIWLGGLWLSGGAHSPGRAGPGCSGGGGEVLVLLIFMEIL